MKKIFVFLFLYSTIGFAQNAIPDASNSFDFAAYQQGMIASAIVGIVGTVFLISSIDKANSFKPDTTMSPSKIEDEQRNISNIARTGYIWLGVGFAGIIISNAVFLPKKRVSLMANSTGIGIRYRL